MIERKNPGGIQTQLKSMDRSESDTHIHVCIHIIYIYISHNHVNIDIHWSGMNWHIESIGYYLWVMVTKSAFNVLLL